MKHTNNNVAETTRILDIDAELDLLGVYRSWAGGQMYNAMMQETGPDHVSEQSIFFAGLNEEIWRDLKEMALEFEKLQIGWRQASEGQYQVVHENGPYLSRNRSACWYLAVENKDGTWTSKYLDHTGKRWMEILPPSADGNFLEPDTTGMGSLILVLEPIAEDRNHGAVSTATLNTDTPELPEISTKTTDTLLANELLLSDQPGNSKGSVSPPSDEAVDTQGPPTDHQLFQQLDLNQSVSDYTTSSTTSESEEPAQPSNVISHWWQAATNTITHMN